MLQARKWEVNILEILILKMPYHIFSPQRWYCSLFYIFDFVLPGCSIPKIVLSASNLTLLYSNSSLTFEYLASLKFKFSQVILFLSFKNKKKNPNGPRIKPCGTPLGICNGSE